MTQLEYFKKWFAARAIETDANAGYTHTDNDITVISLNEHPDMFVLTVDTGKDLNYIGFINENGLCFKVKVLEGMNIKGWAELTKQAFQTRKKINEVRHWYSLIMEKWYVMEFLNENLQTNEQKQTTTKRKVKL